MEERKNKAIQALRALNDESDKIRIDTYDTAKERVDRWKERAVRIIRESISENESVKFEKTVYRPTRLSGDSRDFVVEAIQLYQAKIKVLIEELTNHPESLLDPMNFTSKDKWDFYFKELHPEVQRVSRSRYLSEHYADAVEAAFKELDQRVKSIFMQVRTQEKSGTDLMMAAFGGNPPPIKLSDLSNESERNIQDGYKFIFAGAIQGIRNPKAHENIDIDAKRAMHHLFLASLLFYKLDEAKI